MKRLYKLAIVIFGFTALSYAAEELGKVEYRTIQGRQLMRYEQPDGVTYSLETPQGSTLNCGSMKIQGLSGKDYSCSILTEGGRAKMDPTEAKNLFINLDTLWKMPR